jgi:predicted metal-dependent HD superfamily phosphohydrolase
MSTLSIIFSSLPEGILRSAREAYEAPPRRGYHHFGHVRSVLGQGDLVATEGPGWADPLSVTLAALFHDAIYDASRTDNEARSAQLARQALEVWPVPGADPSTVDRLIELTGAHGRYRPGELSADEALFLDCDLAILGSPPAEFDAYQAGVEAEYTQSMPAMVYRFGRRRFLSKLLATPRLYLSDFFHGRLDDAARSNLRRALQ